MSIRKDIFNLHVLRALNGLRHFPADEIVVRVDRLGRNEEFRLEFLVIETALDLFPIEVYKIFPILLLVLLAALIAFRLHPHRLIESYFLHNF